MSEFAARDVVMRFRTADAELEILRGVDLVVPAGDSVAILGVSGSGKSTLLHILGGLERPSRGQVLWDGIDLYTLEPDQLARFRNETIGFVFQFHHLLPEFSALENVMMPCLLAGWPRRRARARAGEMLEAVGLEARREHGPGKLSGGERQRVAIARALIASPRVILADEPTGNLDSATGEVILKIFDDLKAQGKTVIMVTHETHVADRCDRIITLSDGLVVSDQRQARRTPTAVATTS